MDHCFRFLHAVMHHLSLGQFRQIDGGHLSFQASDLDGIFQVHHAEWTGRDNDVGPCFGSHPNSSYSDTLLFLGFVEEHQSAATTAEGTVARAAHLNSFQSGDGVEHSARIVVDLVVSPEITGVVIRVDVTAVFYGIELDGSTPDLVSNHLTDVLDRRDVLVIVL